MIETILNALRADALTFNDLQPDAQQFLRDFFYSSTEFGAEQRALIDPWWLEVPADRVGELAAINADQVFMVVPVELDGRLLIPAALLSDPIAYGHAFEFLVKLTFVEVPPTVQIPADDE